MLTLAGGPGWIKCKAGLRQAHCTHVAHKVKQVRIKNGGPRQGKRMAAGGGGGDPAREKHGPRPPPPPPRPGSESEWSDL